MLEHAAAISAGSPVTICTASCGQPALVPAHPASQSAASGARSDGLSTIGAPAAIAGATLCATWLSGWLNGVMAAARPTGSRCVTARRARPSAVTSHANTSPSSRSASIAAKRKTSRARCTSWRVSRRLRPDSDVISAATRSPSSAMRSATANSSVERAWRSNS